MTRLEQIMVKMGFDVSESSKVNDAMGKVKEGTKHGSEGVAGFNTHGREMKKLIHEIAHVSPVLGSALKSAFHPESIGIIALLAVFEFVKKKIEAAKEKLKELREEQKEAWTSEQNAVIKVAQAHDDYKRKVAEIMNESRHALENENAAYQRQIELIKEEYAIYQKLAATINEAERADEKRQRDAEDRATAQDNTHEDRARAAQQKREDRAMAKAEEQAMARARTQQERQSIRDAFEARKQALDDLREKEREAIADRREISKRASDIEREIQDALDNRKREKEEEARKHSLEQDLLKANELAKKKTQDELDLANYKGNAMEKANEDNLSKRLVETDAASRKAERAKKAMAEAPSDEEIEKQRKHAEALPNSEDENGVNFRLVAEEKLAQMIKKQSDARTSYAEAIKEQYRLEKAGKASDEAINENLKEQASLKERIRKLAEEQQNLQQKIKEDDAAAKDQDIVKAKELAKHLKDLQDQATLLRGQLAGLPGGGGQAAGGGSAGSGGEIPWWANNNAHGLAGGNDDFSLSGQAGRDFARRMGFLKPEPKAADKAEDHGKTAVEKLELIRKLLAGEDDTGGK